MKIVIADDHGVVLLGTKMIIESELANATVAMVKTYTELLEIYEKDSFDILLLDINMPGTKNLAMIAELKKINSNTKIIVFSSYDEQVALRYIKAGADGYVNKMSEDDEITTAIQSVLENGYYYSQKLATLTMNQLREGVKDIIPKKVLSEREFEVFQLFLAGLGNMEISTRLQIHMSTVSTYKQRILKKLESANTTEMIKRYYLNQ
jgi:DNA-binding NarL/FixJ family response regulator